MAYACEQGALEAPFRREEGFRRDGGFHWRDNRVVFDIAGNKYRLIARISYEYKAVLIKFIGTHTQYDKIDAETVT